MKKWEFLVAQKLSAKSDIFGCAICRDMVRNVHLEGSAHLVHGSATRTSTHLQNLWGCRQIKGGPNEPHWFNFQSKWRTIYSGPCILLQECKKSPVNNQFCGPISSVPCRHVFVQVALSLILPCSKGNMPLDIMDCAAHLWTPRTKVSKLWKLIFFLPLGLSNFLPTNSVVNCRILQQPLSLWTTNPPWTACHCGQRMHPATTAYLRTLLTMYLHTQLPMYWWCLSPPCPCCPRCVGIVGNSSRTVGFSNECCQHLSKCKSWRMLHKVFRLGLHRQVVSTEIPRFIGWPCKGGSISTSPAIHSRYSNIM